MEKTRCGFKERADFVPESAFPGEPGGTPLSFEICSTKKRMGRTWYISKNAIRCLPYLFMPSETWCNHTLFVLELPTKYPDRNNISVAGSGVLLTVWKTFSSPQAITVNPLFTNLLEARASTNFKSLSQETWNPSANWPKCKLGTRTVSAPSLRTGQLEKGAPHKTGQRNLCSEI